MKIAVVGAGAVGCMLAARLHAAGHDLTLIGRPEQVEAISRDGLLLRDAQCAATRHHLHAATALAERPDLALLTMKTQDVAQACREIAPYVEGVPVVAMQNGVQGDHLAASVLGRQAVLGAVVMCAAEYLRPGEVSVPFAGWLIVGEPFRPAGQRARDVVETLGAAVPTFLTRRLGRVRWSKLIFNLNNALCAATGLSLPQIAERPEGRLLSVAVMKEGCRVAMAAGIRLDHGLYGLTPRALRQGSGAALVALLQATLTTVLARLPDRAAMRLLALAGRSRLNRLPIYGSTWQSITRGKPTEIEYLNGEIVRLGRRLGLSTPCNARLLAAIHDVERTRRFVPLAELLPSTAEKTVFQAPVVRGRP